MGYVTLANALIEIWGGTFCFICIACSMIMPFLDEEHRAFSVWMFTVCGIAMFADSAAYVGDGRIDAMSIGLTRIGNFANYCALPILAGVYSRYVIYNTNNKSPFVKKWYDALKILSALLVVAVIVSQFTGSIYYFDETNLYHRGNLCWLFQASILVMVGISMAMLIKSRKTTNRRKFAILLLSTCISLIGGIMTLVAYGIAWIHITMVLSALFIFFEMQYEGTENYVQAKTELANSKSLLMLSQIKPHFIYNSLNAIQYLCRTDPKAASQAIATFSTYLRGNIDSLEGEGEIAVPFKKELGFVRSYLELESLRFGDALEVKWDIQSDRFKIPPLTVQILAENAVKHGIRKSGKSGCVTIRSWDEAGSHIIEVEDNGIGFDVNAPQEDDERAHVGVSNARRRIEAISNGTLEIQSKPGCGTIARISIPQADNSNQTSTSQMQRAGAKER